MKPVYLSMQAFGPFAEVQTINFQELGENPLFLINGPTGAGKSTILDAISFAFYGESTGKERDPASMRCDLSDTDTPTQVVFDFILSGHVYRIIRTPAQELTKKKGVGTTSKGPTAMVYRHKNADLNGFEFDESSDDVDLLPLKGVKEVNEWVKELTGLSSEQFRQVMVLPQGQFRKLLLADSDQREQIFSQLFQTNIYKQIEDQLKQQSAELRNNRKSLNENIVGLLDSVGLTEISELELQLKEVEPAYLIAKANQESALKVALESEKALQTARSVANKFAELSTLKENIDNLNNKNNEISAVSAEIARAEQANRIKPLQQNLHNAKASLTTEVNQKTALEKVIKELGDKHDVEAKKVKLLEPKWVELEEKKQELNDWKRKSQLLAALTDEQAKQSKLSDRLSSVETDIQQHRIAKDQENKRLEELIESIRINNEALVRMPQLQVDFERYDRLGRIRRSVADTQALIGKLKSQEKQSIEQLSKLVAKKDADIIHLQKTELSWHQGQAFELAKQLNNGEPCMVCGSIEHPQPANAGDVNFASIETVDQARIAVQETQGKFSAAEADLTSIRYKIGENEQRINELNTDLGEYSIHSVEWFRDQWKQNQVKLAELTALQKTQQQNLSNQQQSSEQLIRIDTLISELVVTQDSLKIEQAACIARIQERELEIPVEFRNVDALEQKISTLNDYIKRVTLDYNTTVSQNQETQQQLVTHKSLLENVNERISLQTRVISTLEIEWKIALSDLGFKNELEYKDACWLDDYLETQKKIVEDHKTKMADYKSRESYIETELKSLENPDLIKLQEQVTQLGALQREATEKLASLSNEFESLKRVASRLAKIQIQVEAIEAEYKVIGTLADVASGQTGNRVSLQRFVLGVLLDDVLNEASQRLQLMSKGRYRLIRKLDRSKGNKTSGLELEIEDAYSGGRRPANTLSGGESFMAALSLALGLSDVVQNYSGGIKLETLFIDEGFGSLDMESLDLAVQTLIDLRKSGRTIGIISHVSELKEQMSQRIDVVPSDRGSVVTVVHV